MHFQVSVIIPIYNTAPFLVRCCESLFSQTLESIQYIFVDDASTDGSLDVVRDVLTLFPNRQDHIVLLSLPSHQGVGSARQKGLELATGDFVIHCDSDDWVEHDTYEQLFRTAVANHADIATCGYCIDTIEGKCLAEIPALPHSDKISFAIGPQTGSLCLKLIRRDFILRNNLKIPTDISWGEDLCFSLYSLLTTNRLFCIDKPLYHYVQHSQSLTHRITTAKCMDLLKCGTKVEQFLKNNNLLEEYRYQLNWLKFQLKQYFLVFPETRAISSWRSFYPESNDQLRYYSTPLYLKIVSWLILHHLSPLAALLLYCKDHLRVIVHS